MYFLGEQLVVILFSSLSLPLLSTWDLTEGSLHLLSTVSLLRAAVNCNSILEV